MGVLIRQAKESDIDWLLVELKKFSVFYASKYDLYSKDEKYNRYLLDVLIKSHLFLIAEENELPIGFICGTVSGHFFNPELKTLQEVFWWVKEEKRQGFAGAKLLQAFIDYGKANCQWVVMTLEDGSPVNPDSLLNRGFKPKECNFIMEV